MKTASALALALAAVLGAFATGWWSGRSSGPQVPESSQPAVELDQRLAAIERELASVNETVTLLREAADLRDGAASAALQSARAIEVAIGDSPARGREDAPITIVEFGDFECPHCRAAYATVERLRAEYPEEIRWVFKHRPMPFHRRALAAHRAAVAAERQGKFWEMHDRLFAEGSALDQAELEATAEAIGLELDAFRAAMDDPRLADPIRADKEQAERLGVLGVPAFYINGRLVPGAQPYEYFRDRIEEALRRS